MDFLKMPPGDLPAFDDTYGFQQTRSPNPNWTYGQKIEATQEGREWAQGETKGWKVVDTEKEDPIKLYILMISGIVPRPIAFVSTISNTGIENLAPFSWFNMVTHSPPVVSISCSNGPVRVHDTTDNIKANRGFTVNIISEPWVEAANVCSIDAPAEVSEWPLSGLTKAPSVHVKPARVKESAFSMECELLQIIDIIHPVTQKATTSLILGTVKYIHVRKDVLTDKGAVDPAKLKAVGRMGDITYSRIGDGFRLPRPLWEKEVQGIEKALQGLIVQPDHSE
ncbi:hypothetical protein GLOTRDRAFT_57674 [Gloeophyllum trabeum ATCC 11539]|uniref:Flavin reductase like domain-containing protein n=1 Tax=Gloeophyllum trabeum (strain ATCC 11539 / FP-39264 / Madison 617) TaxID=670483 RepID=S7QFI1_GLOTA|nr:uncharacterized protein GLOTRDRAFT_57674 [Gloeophyllum trabeum ATCC 11539]EPQ58596.1 hypothetical protein GLOTRDRAFT_57674 [Gloeophyllum trabeum ATCC 11539]